MSWADSCPFESIHLHLRITNMEAGAINSLVAPASQHDTGVVESVYLSSLVLCRAKNQYLTVSSGKD